jgi:hypothetical protein
MSQDQSVSPDAVAPDEQSSIVEWGTDEAPRRPLHRLADALRNDRRIIPVIAGLGGIALFASFVGDWQVIIAYDAPPDGNTSRRFTTGVADLDGLGTAFLVGTLALVTAAALVLFGPPRGRAYARVAGLSLAGGVGALLVATAVQLRELTGPFNVFFFFAAEQRQPDVSAGRGLQAAFVGVALLGFALFLAGRRLRDDAAGDLDLRAASVGDDDTEAMRGDRGPRGARRAPAPQAAALDLTVAPAAPFVRFTDDRSIQ